MKIVSLFSGCGGLDLGFEKAGFDVIWANEYDKTIWETYEFNHKGTTLDRRSITDIPVEDVPECDGIVGGPPCQSWSIGGSKRGLNDKRGQLFWDYIRILNAKNPKFFVAENVKGMLLERYGDALDNFKEAFKSAGKYGYDLYFQLVNAADYGVPEDRERVLFIGIRKDLSLSYSFPEPTTPQGQRITLKDTIWDIRNAKPQPLPNGIVEIKPSRGKVKNNEYMTGGFSPIYMSRNRVRSWDEVSFTIQASGRQAPIHPSAPKMVNVGKDKYEFVSGKEGLYRRLSIREAARIQTFPDDFVFKYNNINNGYKMIGNAVPVNLAYVVAQSIAKIFPNE
jgi:DNA (cytosine-5)-methyltransferase 1